MWIRWIRNKSVCSSIITGLMVLNATLAFSADVGPRLKQLLRTDLRPARLAKAAAPNGELRVLIRGNPPDVRRAVREVGGKPGTTVGDITTARVTLGGLAGLVRSPGVVRVEQSPLKSPVNDRIVRRIGAKDAHNGTPPLPGAYTGAGVIVGVIDSGIDFAHEDFRDAADSSKTRILSIWDQTHLDPGRPPVGFEYGTVWTQAEIEADIAGVASIPHIDSVGHGTHVTGTAAGNGSAIGRHAGVAPAADLIIVKGLDDVVDGASYIFRQADSLGLPAIVNFSASTHLGPHDGSSLEEQAIDDLVAEVPGRVFVAAASNDGNSFIHWGGFDLEADSLWTYYHGGLVDKGNEEYEMLVDIAGTLEFSDPSDTYVAVGMDTTRYRSFSVESLGYHGRTRWYSMEELLDASTSLVDTLDYLNGTVSASLELSATRLDNGKVHFFLTIYDEIGEIDFDTHFAAGADLFRVMFLGSGEIHTWAPFSLSGEHDGVRVDIDDDRYRPTDNRSSVGIPATAKNVIGVGASTSAVGDIGIEGALAGFSSRGPTPDNRIKPDIVAPGDGVTSSLSKDYEFLFAADGGRHFTGSGTSFSAPVVTGAVALYLESRPDATHEDVLEAFTRHTLEDAFTGSYGALPNNHWGHGKLDLLAALTDGTASTIDVPEIAIDTLAIGGKTGGRLFTYAPMKAHLLVLDEPEDVSIYLLPNFDAVLSLYRGSSLEDLTSENRIQFSNFNLTDNFEIIDVSLAPGRYLIMISAYLGLEFKNYNLELRRRFFNTRAFDLQLEATKTGELETGEQRHIYIFSLPKTTKIRIDLNSGFDAFVGLFKGTSLSVEGRILGFDDAVVSETVTQTLEAGSYAISVNTNDITDFGEYTISLQEVVELDPSAARSDFDNSSRVDFPDFLAFASSFGSRSGDVGYDDRMDFDLSGRIDFSDFLEFAGDFGKRVR